MPDRLPLTRRQLLRAGAGLAGLAAAGRLIGASTEAAYAAASSSDWSDLAGSIQGTLIMPSDPAFATARLAFNTLYDYVIPQAVLQASGPRDVQTALAFCRGTGIRPTPRSGGHSFQGFSTSTGLIIDMSRMDGVAMNAKRTRVRIGAGAKLLGIYSKMFQQGKMAIPGGTCPQVGISGLTQGGGVGPFTREYGLTLDRLGGAQMVTADGKFRNVSATENPDLFWAIRGGGGGSFGIVTAFDFEPLPVDMTIISTRLTFGWQHAARLLELFQEWPESLPASASPLLDLSTANQAPGAQPRIAVAIWHRGPRARSNKVIAELIREVGAAPTTRTELKQGFFSAEYDDFCEGFTARECAPVTSPGGMLPRAGVSTYSDISRKPWPRAANEVIIEEIERWQRDPLLQPPEVSNALQNANVHLTPFGGAVHDTPPTATAFPYRDGRLIYRFQARVRPGAPQETVDAAQAWVERLYSRLTPWRTGDEYSNFGNRRLDQWGEAYFGVNLPRLRSIKASVDPTNLFRFEQSIRPSSR